MRLNRKILFPFLIFIILISIQLKAADSLQTRPKIGLVLSGGGARGLAHTGVLKMIDSLQIPIDYIVGTSMGGIMGALYSIGYSGEEIEQMALGVDWNEMLTDRPARRELPYLQKKDDGRFQLELGIRNLTPVIPSGLIEGQKISLLFSNLTSRHCAVNHFSQLPIPYKCIAIDMVSGKEVVLDHGSLPKAMRATMSIPTVFSPVEWGDSLLVDGGILNNFPADIISEMGADIIIGVNVGTPLKKKGELAGLIALLEQTLVITDFYRQQENQKLCELVITPELEGFGTGNFDKKSVRRIIRQGNKAARQNKSRLQEIKNRYADGFKKDSVKIDSKSSHSDTRQEKIIFGLTVSGNENIPFMFIHNHLGIEPGMPFEAEYLNKRIDELYALGYFDLIAYDIEAVRENYIRINLYVKEKPIRKFRLGLRYDDFYKLVGIWGIQINNFPFSGIWAESTLQFAGKIKYDYRISYPSRTLNLPLIPYVRAGYRQIPLEIYHPKSGAAIARYDDRAWYAGAGIGLRLGSFGIIDTEYSHEYINIKPNYAGLDPNLYPSWKDELRKIDVNFIFDMLDDVIIPRRGMKLISSYTVSTKSFGSAVNYQQVQIQADLYKEISRRHVVRLNGFYTTFADDLPVYKSVIAGGPDTFIGMHYGQAEARKLYYGRIDYRYEYKRDIFFKIMANAGMYPKNPAWELFDDKLIYGYGFSLKLISIIGPFELFLTRGSRSIISNTDFAVRIYFKAGYYF